MVGQGRMFSFNSHWAKASDIDCFFTQFCVLDNRSGIRQAFYGGLPASRDRPPILFLFSWNIFSWTFFTEQFSDISFAEKCSERIQLVLQRIHQCCSPFVTCASWGRRYQFFVFNVFWSFHLFHIFFKNPKLELQIPILIF